VTGGTYVVTPAYVCEVTWGTGPAGSVQVVETITATGCNTTNSASVTITAIGLKGTITYYKFGAVCPPMSNVTVILRNASNTIEATTTTDPTGYYEFATVPGTVTKIELSTVKAWGGGNSTDALAMSRRAIGNFPIFWTPVYHIDEVGDVNASNIVNATDALLVKRRAIQLVSSFAAGDWSFYSGADNLMFNNSAAGTASLAYTPVAGTTKNIQAMAYGDVNGSFTPSGAKNSIAVISDGVMNIGVNQVFELPVKVDTQMDLSALTLYLNYAETLLEVVDVKSDLPGLLYNVQDGAINLAWSEVEPVSIPERGALVTLVMKSRATITPEQELFTWNSISEFANFEGERIEPVNIVMSRLDNTGAHGFNDEPNMTYTFSVNPNPFRRIARIDVTLPETASVKVTLLNKLGQTVAILTDRTMDQGLNSFELGTESLNLQNGVYFLRLDAVGGQSTCSRTIKVVYTK
jgi:hypothetical protein